MSEQVTWAMAQDVDLSAKAVLLTVAHMADGWTATTTGAALARAMHAHERTVRHALDRLEALDDARDPATAGGIDRLTAVTLAIILATFALNAAVAGVIAIVESRPLDYPSLAELETGTRAVLRRVVPPPKFPKRSPSPPPNMSPNRSLNAPISSTPAEE